MVKTILRMGAMTALFAFLTGCGDAPVDVSLESSTTGNGSRVVISSRVDDVELQGFSINRGNCRGSFFEKGRHLKFGQISKIFASCNPENVKEVEVKTDQGEFTFSFD